MTDHATYLNQLLLSPTITYEERFQIRNTLAVVDAVRGSAPKPVVTNNPGGIITTTTADWKLYGRMGKPEAPHDAAGSPQGDEQPEPGQVDGGEAAEAGEFSDCPRCDRHLRAVQHFKSRAEKAEAQLESSRRGGVVLSSADYNTLVARAEHAEAEAKMQQQRARHFKSQNEQAEAERDDALAMAAQSELDRVEEKDKADRAEAERDAILKDLATIRTNYLNVHVVNVNAADVMVKTMGILIDRYTPEG